MPKFCKIGYIYCVLDTTNGKMYIGKTTKKPSRRWVEHKTRAKNRKEKNNRFYNAVNAHGEENFVLIVLKIVPKKNLSKNEIEYIAKFDTYNNGYNSTLGGEGSNGNKLTAERKKEIGDFHRGKKLSPEHKAIMLYYSKNRERTVSERENSSLVMMEYWEKWRKGGIIRKKRPPMKEEHRKATGIRKKKENEKYLRNWKILERFSPDKKHIFYKVQCETCDFISTRQTHKHKNPMLCINCRKHKIIKK